MSSIFLKPKIRIFLFLIILLLLSGCSSFLTPDLKEEVYNDPALIHIKTVDKQDAGFVEAENEKKLNKLIVTKELKSFYTENIVKNRKTEKDIFLNDTEKIELLVEDMAVRDFIKYVFSDLLEVDFILAPSLSSQKLDKTISLRLKNEVTSSELFSVVRELLSRNGVSVNLTNSVFVVSDTESSETSLIGYGNSESDIPKGSFNITQFVKLSYLEPGNILSILPPKSGVKIRIVNGENMISISGKREAIKKALSVINMLDRPSMRGRYVRLYEIIYSDIAFFKEKLKELLDEEGIPFSKSPGGRGVYLSSLEKRGYVIIFAANKSWMKRTLYWASIIDKPEKQNRKKYFVYFPKNSRAEELADSLRLFTGSTQDKINSTSSTTATKKSKSKSVSVFSDENVKISVDENRNALIIYSTLEDYKVYKDLFLKLDIMPPQVLIEASVIEVTLTDKLQYGLEWFVKAKKSGDDVKIGTRKGLGLGSGGLDFLYLAGSKDFEVAVNAMMKNDRVKLLQKPRLIVRDGKNASMVVGTEVPVITSESVSSDSITNGSSDTTRSVQYRSTGVALNVTPTVHSKGIITLEIGQEVSEAQANKTSSISSPIILKRSINTEVVASDGQTIVLGGLIKENSSVTKIKVPILGDIPILGHLFKTTSNGGDRTELVVLITPYIVSETSQIDAVNELVFESFHGIGIKK